MFSYPNGDRPMFRIKVNVINNLVFFLNIATLKNIGMLFKHAKTQHRVRFVILKYKILQLSKDYFILCCDHLEVNSRCMAFMLNRNACFLHAEQMSVLI